MRYIAERDCWAFGRLWKKGDVAEFAAGERVPVHFRMAEPPKTEKQAGTLSVNEMKAMNYMQLQKLAREKGIRTPPGTKQDDVIEQMLRYQHLYNLAKEQGIEVPANATMENLLEAING